MYIKIIDLYCLV